MTKDYLYTAKDQTCNTTVTTRVAPLNSYVWKTAYKNADLKAMIAVEPVAVAVDATNWGAYSSGKFSNCAKNINHAVVAVGYNSNGWIIRNSWGSSWGNKGHIVLAYGNTCGIWNYPSYPVVA